MSSLSAIFWPFRATIPLRIVTTVGTRFDAAREREALGINPANELLTMNGAMTTIPKELKTDPDLLVVS